MYNSEGDMVVYNYLDRVELAHLEKLLKKWSDETISIGFEYRSIEGIIFKKFAKMHLLDF